MESFMKFPSNSTGTLPADNPCIHESSAMRAGEEEAGKTETEGGKLSVEGGISLASAVVLMSRPRRQPFRS